MVATKCYSKYPLTNLSNSTDLLQRYEKKSKYPKKLTYIHNSTKLIRFTN